MKIVEVTDQDQIDQLRHLDHQLGGKLKTYFPGITPEQMSPGQRRTGLMALKALLKARTIAIAQHQTLPPAA